MKKQLRLLTAILLIFVTVFGMNIEASAAGTVIDTTLVRRADLPNITDASGVNCTGVQAMGVSRGTNCLYSIKIHKGNANAVLYYFPDISDWDTKVVFTIEGVGHANGMTVDTDYIYICANPNGAEGNEIIRISRDFIAEEADRVKEDDKTKVATEVISERLADEDYKIMQPMIVKNNSNGTTTYEPYDSEFSTITRAESTGKFIIGKSISGVTTDNRYNGFTRAEIIGDNFVVSNDPDDTFLVENNIVYKNAAKQDIYYLQGYGLFIGRWMRDYDDKISADENAMRNPGRSVILWADIDNTNCGTYAGYRCYIPDKIRAYMDTYKELGVNKYHLFEIESMGITANGNLIATFNVSYSGEYKTAYENKYGVKVDTTTTDGVYKITRSDGKTFKLSDKV